MDAVDSCNGDMQGIDVRLVGKRNIRHQFFRQCSRIIGDIEFGNVGEDFETFTSRLRVDVISRRFDCWK